ACPYRTYCPARRSLASFASGARGTRVRRRRPRRCSSRVHAKTRCVRWKLDAVDERNARPRVLREQEVAVEGDAVEDGRDMRAGRDAEPRLDHAAEHAAEAERAGGVHHPQGLPYPTRLRELDVDPV